MPLKPTGEQIKALVNSELDGPVVMLNLLKYKARADDGAGSGSDAYRKYGDAAVEMIEARGGKVIWAGRAEQVLIGDPAEPWDTVLLVQYPSRAAFIEMVSTPEYEQAHEHREAGLERTIVIACNPAMDLLGEGAR
jgi:uncharacterized protein (DUF1330 family)